MKKPIIIVLILFIVAAIAFAFEKSGTPQDAVTKQEEMADNQLSFTSAEVAAHNSKEDCYTIVGTNVYNLTAWVTRHPGGEAAILGICGKDATAAFGKQHGGNEKAQAALASFFIGTVK